MLKLMYHVGQLLSLSTLARDLIINTNGNLTHYNSSRPISLSIVHSLIYIL